MKKVILLVIVTIASVQMSRANFPIGYGRWKLTPGYNYYNAKGYWKSDGSYNAYNNNSSFSSHYFGLEGGYGLSRRLNFLFALPFVVQFDNNTSGTAAIPKSYLAAGLGDAKVGLSYFFSDFDALNHVSLTGSLIVPLYTNKGAPFPNLGYGVPGGEVKLGFSGSATGGFRNPYYDMEFGVRQYFATDGPTQLFANITGGVPLDDYYKLSGTLSGVNSFSSGATTSTSTTQVFYNYNKSFDYVRAAFNIGRVINENTEIWGGLYADVFGTSVGRGSGVSLSAVFKF
jgi:lipid-A-disaccharide synthase-like uncharacterized protein